MAQEQPKIQVFGGYSYLNTPQAFSVTPEPGQLWAIIRNNGGTHQNGINASVNFNLLTNLDLAIDTNTSFQRDARDIYMGFGSGIPREYQVGVTATTYSFLIGPQVRLWRVNKLSSFGRALFGISKTNREYTAITRSLFIAEQSQTTDAKADTGFAFAVGGGVDLRCSRRISIRLFQADYMRVEKEFIYDKNVFAGSVVIKDRIANNLRISTGIVIAIGLREK